MEGGRGGRVGHNDVPLSWGWILEGFLEGFQGVRMGDPGVWLG